MQVIEEFSIEYRFKVVSKYHIAPLLSFTSLGFVRAPSKTKLVTYGIVVVTVTPSEQTTLEFSFALFTATTLTTYVPTSGAS